MCNMKTIICATLWLDGPCQLNYNICCGKQNKIGSYMFFLIVLQSRMLGLFSFYVCFDMAEYVLLKLLYLLLFI